MWEDGVRTVVPVWRNDAGNAGLASAVRAGFSARGGSVVEGVTYGAETQDFSATVTALRAQLEQAIAQHGSSHVAVYLAAFDEVVAFFASAQADPVLASVRWYGSDAVAQSALLQPAAAEFAIRTDANPVFGLDEGARDIWGRSCSGSVRRTNLEPDAFALGVYDAVWVVARLRRLATLDIDRLNRRSLRPPLRLRRHRLDGVERGGRPPLQRLRLLGRPHGRRRAALDRVAQCQTRTVEIVRWKRPRKRPRAGLRSPSGGFKQCDQGIPQRCSRRMYCRERLDVRGRDQIDAVSILCGIGAERGLPQHQDGHRALHRRDRGADDSSIPAFTASRSA
jgi:hypothetical protein